MFKCKHLANPYGQTVKKKHDFKFNFKKTTAMNSSQTWSMSEYRTTMFNNTAFVIRHVTERKKIMDSRKIKTEIAI
jgi:ribosomal protein S18